MAATATANANANTTANTNTAATANANAGSFTAADAEETKNALKAFFEALQRIYDKFCDNIGKFVGAFRKDEVIQRLKDIQDGVACMVENGDMTNEQLGTLTKVITDIGEKLGAGISREEFHDTMDEFDKMVDNVMLKDNVVVMEGKFTAKEAFTRSIADCIREKNPAWYEMHKNDLEKAINERAEIIIKKPLNKKALNQNYADTDVYIRIDGMMFKATAEFEKREVKTSKSADDGTVKKYYKNIAKTTISNLSPEEDAEMAKEFDDKNKLKTSSGYKYADSKDFPFGQWYDNPAENMMVALCGMNYLKFYPDTDAIRQEVQNKLTPTGEFIYERYRQAHTTQNGKFEDTAIGNAAGDGFDFTIRNTENKAALEIKREKDKNGNDCVNVYLIPDTAACYGNAYKDHYKICSWESTKDGLKGTMNIGKDGIAGISQKEIYELLEHSDTKKWMNINQISTFQQEYAYSSATSKMAFYVEDPTPVAELKVRLENVLNGYTKDGHILNEDGSVTAKTDNINDRYKVVLSESKQNGTFLNIYEEGSDSYISIAFDPTGNAKSIRLKDENGFRPVVDVVLQDKAVGIESIKGNPLEDLIIQINEQIQESQREKEVELLYKENSSALGIKNEQKIASYVTQAALACMDKNRNPAEPITPQFIAEVVHLEIPENVDSVALRQKNMTLVFAREIMDYLQDIGVLAGNRFDPDNRTVAMNLDRYRQTVFENNEFGGELMRDYKSYLKSQFELHYFGTEEGQEYRREYLERVHNQVTAGDKSQTPTEKQVSPDNVHKASDNAKPTMPSIDVPSVDEDKTAERDLVEKAQEHRETSEENKPQRSNWGRTSEVNSNIPDNSDFAALDNMFREGGKHTKETDEKLLRSFEQTVFNYITIAGNNRVEGIAQAMDFGAMSVDDKIEMIGELINRGLLIDNKDGTVSVSGSGIDEMLGDDEEQKKPQKKGGERDV